MMLSLITRAPWPILVKPEQLMNVGVIVAVCVGGGVNEGVKVKVDGGMFVAIPATVVKFNVANLVAVSTAVNAGVLVIKLLVGTFDGVLVSAEKPVGTAEPRIGMEIRKVRALEETI